MHRLGGADAAAGGGGRGVRGGRIAWSGGALAGDVAARFGALVAEAASPIDDVRGTAAYRSHALSVLAARTLTWAWEERCA